MADDNIIRESAVDGSFYPADPGELTGQIRGYLEKAPSLDISNIKALICPHAGYIYSGQIAAYSYKQIAGLTYDSIIVIAPSHGQYFDYISVYHGDGYRTPLGAVAIDKERALMLSGASKAIKLSDSGHGREHSLEVQLPFLQLVAGSDIKIIPIIIGDQSKESIEALGNTIGKLFSDDNILIIASTDLSHYHPYDIASGLDGKVSRLIDSFDTEGLMEEFTAGRAEMCGGGPVISAMIASRAMGADSSKVIKYANSGDISGDRSAVVGYLSAAFYKK